MRERVWTTLILIIASFAEAFAEFVPILRILPLVTCATLAMHYAFCAR
jgi:hypothetical protein